MYDAATRTQSVRRSPSTALASWNNAFQCCVSTLTLPASRAMPSSQAATRTYRHTVVHEAEQRQGTDLGVLCQTGAHVELGGDDLPLPPTRQRQTHAHRLWWANCPRELSCVVASVFVLTEAEQVRRYFVDTCLLVTDLNSRASAAVLTTLLDWIVIRMTPSVYNIAADSAL